MTIYKISVIAESIGIEPRKKNKADLVKAIQLEEGSAACFKTAGTYCDQPDCFWRDDCLK